jgi:putative sigma-54 modulation protein
MQTNFKFRHMKSSDALRDYADERLEKIKRYFSDPIEVRGAFSIEKLLHTARFDVTLRNGLQLHAAESTENMYSSIDMALAKMERQVRRYKDRITDHKKNVGRGAKVRMSVIAGEGPSEAAVNEATRETEPEPDVIPNIVHKKEFKAERLSVQQAIMQMNLLNNVFLVFVNADTGQVNVVYHRDDGSYGLIEADTQEA